MLRKSSLTLSMMTMMKKMMVILMAKELIAKMMMIKVFRKSQVVVPATIKRIKKIKEIRTLRRKTNPINRKIRI
jgi:histone deacetylase complex regulatory component SIN3